MDKQALNHIVMLGNLLFKLQTMACAIRINKDKMPLFILMDLNDVIASHAKIAKIITGCYFSELERQAPLTESQQHTLESCYYPAVENMCRYCHLIREEFQKILNINPSEIGMHSHWDAMSIEFDKVHKALNRHILVFQES